MKTTSRLNIVEIKESDFPELLKLYQQHENMKFIMSGKSDYQLNELKEKWNILKYNTETKVGFQIIKLKSNNQIIGECGLLNSQKPKNEEIEIAYMIDKTYWNQGFGSEICRFLIEEAFETVKTERIIAGMYADNVKSIKLIEKQGFTLSNEGVSKSGIHFKEFELLRTKKRQ